MVSYKGSAEARRRSLFLNRSSWFLIGNLEYTFGMRKIGFSSLIMLKEFLVVRIDISYKIGLNEGVILIEFLVQFSSPLKSLTCLFHFNVRSKLLWGRLLNSKRINLRG